MELVKVEIFGSGLVLVESPELVARYNNCLKQLGIPLTSLKSFHIDGLGWSPEIANEHSNQWYLSAGIANPMAIIITIDQQNRPIYMPFSSFDRKMMKAFFAANGKQIADITTTHGLCLDVDQELSEYESPTDLLLVNSITVRSTAGGLLQKAKLQAEMIATLIKEPLAWFDPRNRQALIQNVTDNGDMRFRNLEIPDFHFNEFGSWHTQAFNGVFILRQKKRATLVLEDQNYLDGIKDAITIGDPALIGLLKKQGWIDLDLKWYKNHPETIQHLKECISADIICNADPTVALNELSQSQRKQRIRSAPKDERLKLLQNLERLQASFDSSPIELTPDLELLLYHPKASLEKGDRKVIWKLLTRFQRFDVLRRYTADKNYFALHYNQWPDSKKNWAAGLINKEYRPEMFNNGL